MKVSEIHFICVTCLEYIVETRNINVNYKKLKSDPRNPFLEIQTNNILGVIDRIKEQKCHRCKD